MKKLLLFFVLNISLSCDKTDCIEISKKYEGDGSYYFEYLVYRGDDNINALPPATLVNEETFNKYKVGDKYCPDL